MDELSIKKMFLYRVTSGLKIVENDTVRTLICKLALVLNCMLEDSEEKTLGLQKLQEAQYWFLAALKSQDIKRCTDILGKDLDVSTLKKE